MQALKNKAKTDMKDKDQEFKYKGIQTSVGKICFLFLILRKKIEIWS